LYTPKYCCECGEKIERNDWKLWTSRRFCENCESDFKGQTWLPLIWIIFGLVGLLYGFGSFLKKPEKPLNLVTTQTASNKNQNSQNQSNAQILNGGGIQTAAQKTEASNIAAAQTNQQTLNAAVQKPSATKQNSSETRQNSAAEAVYICGAQTKKGTACLRRVKGGGRCWQHLGQPAMLPPEKLLVSR
ncbi:MAG: hypothetical protein ACR2GD_14180, partial [Pyrinomonadaceae bacterium]